MDRKDFIKRMAGVVFFTIPVMSVLSCSDSGDDGPSTSGNSARDCLKNGTQSSISSNHGHTLQVSKDDVESGIAKQYAIAGSSGHDHNVSISSDDFSKLKSNQQIQVGSTTSNGHNHSITVSCA